MSGFLLLMLPFRQLRAVGVSVRWRWRRFFVRRRRLLIPAVLAFGVAGVLWSGDLHLWMQRTVLVGHAPVRGQILVRPLVGPGVVRDAAVRLVPLGPSDAVGVLVSALAGRPSPLVVRPDHAGRWHVRRVRRGWHYAVVVEAEGCGARLAGPVDAGWLVARSVDLRMRSCMPEPSSPPCP